MSDNKQPNWDKITEGKIRHGFAVEAFSKDRKLDGDLMKEIDRWVYFVVHGYHDLKEVLKNGKMSPEEVKDAIIEKFDG